MECICGFTGIHMWEEDFRGHICGKCVNLGVVNVLNFFKQVMAFF